MLNKKRVGINIIFCTQRYIYIIFYMIDYFFFIIQNSVMNNPAYRKPFKHVRLVTPQLNPPLSTVGWFASTEIYVFTVQHICFFRQNHP